MKKLDYRTLTIAMRTNYDVTMLFLPDRITEKLKANGLTRVMYLYVVCDTGRIAEIPGISEQDIAEIESTLDRFLSVEEET